MGPPPPEGREKFAASLERRRQAAKGLEQDLLNEVPLLYGSAGSMESQGDPGVVLAKIHREELLRRNGGGVFRPSTKRSDVALPWERTMEVVLVLFVVFLLFGS
jgi:hypothetical protein